MARSNFCKKFCDNSPFKKQKESFGDKVTRKLGGGKKIAGCKYNPGG